MFFHKDRHMFKNAYWYCVCADVIIKTWSNYLQYNYYHKNICLNYFSYYNENVIIITQTAGLFAG